LKQPGGEVTKLTASGSVAQGNLLYVSGSYGVASKEGVPVARGQYDQLWKRDNGQWKVQSEMWRIDPSSQRDPTLADQLESQWTSAYNAGNAPALAAPYNNDAVLSTRPTGRIEGKEALEGFWKDDFGGGKPTTKLALTDVYLAGDLAHLEGEYEVADRGQMTKGHYVQLWMQDGDAWRIHREVWWQ
jgi:ketosteroid isomerase-like protein